MKKIPTIFLRDPENMKHVTTEPNPAAAWVFAGEGTPTRKYDGTCVMYDGKDWWARREVKTGKQAPPNWIAVDPDPITGKVMGWEPIEQSGWTKYHTEALTAVDFPGATYEWAPGTYELCGPKVMGNPEGFDGHQLVKHSEAVAISGVERTYESIREVVAGLRRSGVEGVVFHHPDGRMAKIKGRDFPA